MKKHALFCMVLAGTLIVGGCGQKAADSTTATAQVTETSDSAPADKPDGAPGDNSDKPGNPPDGAPGSMDGKQAPPDGGNGGPEGPGGPGGQSAAPTSYKAVSSYSTDTEEDGKTYTSTGTDENAVLVTDGANVTLKNFTMDCNSSDSTGGDNSSFYGTGAAALATNGSLTLTGGTITTDAKGGAGVFSYGDGKVTVSDTTEEDGKTYTSTGTDENAVLVTDGANVTLKNFTMDCNSSDSTGGDNSSFYGTGAAALATNGSLTLTGGTITTDAKGGAGVFSYGDGKVTVSDTTITTKQDTSGGIHVAGGGTLTASNLTVETNGESSAAIRSDRGGGTMTVDGGTYTSRGTGSPAVYCTADITVNNAALTAENSEAVCIEGLNSLSLTNCSLSGNIPENEQNDCDWTVILYQSMSGDSEIGESKFSMDGGSLTSLNGGLFYTTNTESSFYLKNVDITYSPSNNFFLKCTGNANKRGWGQSGNNGADCTFTADSQEMSGDILWDSISNLDLKLTNGTILTGSILQDETNAGDGGDGTCDITIDALSAWTVTGNSTVTSLTCNGSITGDDGKSVTIAGTDGTVFVQGTGKYTITTGSYNE